MKWQLASPVCVSVLSVCVPAAPPPEKALVVYGHELDQLFTDQRGCTVYRFYDQGDFRYYVVGPTGVAQMLPTTTHVTDTQTTTVEVDTGGAGGGGHGHDGHK